MKLKVWIFSLVVLRTMTIIDVTSAKIDGWDTSPNIQYHIQTDEGPERYFKYQTISGQYRKEKRLEDGTVVGSYGWVDADGYLRLNDYIADNEGYRIVRTKRLFVGSQKPIDSALQSSKYIPVQADAAISSPLLKKNKIEISQSYPQDKSKYLIFPSSSSSPLPTVFAKRRPTPPHRYYPISTPPSVIAHSNDDIIDVAITPQPHYYNLPSTLKTLSYQPKQAYNKAPLYTTVVKSRPHYNQNSFSQNTYFGDKVYNIGRRSDYALPAESDYDGISMTRNGFKYYLPRHYHEEESDGIGRNGSFGYIDPFGIRRVVYYNTSPGSGFVHKKNNRYVGFNSTPYDPRP